MKPWVILLLLVSLAGCAPAPSVDLPLLAFGAEDACALREIERTRGFDNGPVKACVPPTDDQLVLACRVAESLVLNPNPELGDPPGPEIRVRATQCRLTDAEQGRAQCVFEQRVSGGEWVAASVSLTRTYWSYMDPHVSERGISWRADGPCASPTRAG